MGFFARVCRSVLNLQCRLDIYFFRMNMMQQDVQEVNRILQQHLEEKLKGSKLEGIIENLFKCEIITTIECLHVDVKSSRKEILYGLCIIFYVHMK